MCEIENFGHPLAIAFTLSAVFYYVELRKVATERTGRVLENHSSALVEIRQRLSTIVIGSSDAPLGRIIMGTARKAAQRKSWRAFWREDLEVVSFLFVMTLMLLWLKISIMRTKVSVHLNAWMSSLVSLGALIYAGYAPEELDCGIMTLILVLSFYSFAWNLWIYLAYIPGIDWLVRHMDKLIQALLLR